MSGLEPEEQLEQAAADFLTMRQVLDSDKDWNKLAVEQVRMLELALA